MLVFFFPINARSVFSTTKSENRCGVWFRIGHAKNPKRQEDRERNRLNSRSIYFENTPPLIKLQCTTSKTRGDQRINKNNNICPWKSSNNNNSSSSFASSHLLTPGSWAHRCSENLCFIARHPQTHTHTSSSSSSSQQQSLQLFCCFGFSAFSPFCSFSLYIR